MLIPTTHPEDMDTGAMMLRAHDRGIQLEAYDPNQLVIEISNLLTERGLHPELPEGTGRAGMALGASGMLLRAFGILPATAYIDRINAPDAESR